MTERIKLLLADDRTKERTALRKQLASSALNATVVGETGVGAETVTAVHDLDPDIVLLSLEEPLTRPLRILESMTITGSAPVIAISSIGERDCLRKAMRAGAREYLVKPLNIDELGKTIESIYIAEQQKRSLLSSGAVDTSARGEVISVFSAKGGTGKTTISANLAVALASETKRRVALMDLNLEQGDIPIMLDILPEKNIADLVRIIDRLESDMIQGFLAPHDSEVQVLAAPNQLNAAQTVNPRHVAKIIQLLAMSFDYIVVDTSPTLTPNVMSALELSNMVLLVATPELPCLKNTKAMLETLKSEYSYNGKVKLLVNNPYSTSGSPNEVGKLIDYPIFWKMPQDSFVAECIKLGRPFVQAKRGARVSRNIIDLARVIAGLPAAERKLFGIFGK